MKSWVARRMDFATVSDKNMGGVKYLKIERH